MTLQAASEQARVDSEKQARFMALLTPCLAKLSHYCHAMTKDANDRSSGENGRDLLSDAILLAYENFEKLRATEAFTSYIFTTARRLYYRRARRQKLWGVFGNGVNEIADERGQSPEVKLDLEALDRALAKLPEKQREAVVLFEISELSLAEIREIQGGSLSGVKSRIVRGREKLAELLGERTANRSGGGDATRHARRTNPTSFERARVATLMREKL